LKDTDDKNCINEETHKKQNRNQAATKDDCTTTWNSLSCTWKKRFVLVLL